MALARGNHTLYLVKFPDAIGYSPAQFQDNLISTPTNFYIWRLDMSVPEFNNMISTCNLYSKKANSKYKSPAESTMISSQIARIEPCGTPTGYNKSQSAIHKGLSRVSGGWPLVAVYPAPLVRHGVM